MGSCWPPIRWVGSTARSSAKPEDEADARRISEDAFGRVYELWSVSFSGGLRINCALLAGTKSGRMRPLDAAEIDAYLKRKWVGCSALRDRRENDPYLTIS
jgi:hypothetical protein